MHVQFSTSYSLHHHRLIRVFIEWRGRKLFSFLVSDAKNIFSLFLYFIPRVYELCIIPTPKKSLRALLSMCVLVTCAVACRTILWSLAIWSTLSTLKKSNFPVSLILVQKNFFSLIFGAIPCDFPSSNKVECEKNHSEKPILALFLCLML